MKLKSLTYSGIGIAVAGYAAIGITGGAGASRNVETVHVNSSLAAYTATASGDREYTVRSGDTLAGIAGREYGSAGCWPGIYAANSGSVKNPNVIYVGQRLQIPGSCGTRGPARTITVAVTSRTTVPRATTDTSSSSAGETSFQTCVIARESGGNADVWNASGHWGLYQFSKSTWIAYGGPASEFGNASVAEQNHVFDNAMATPGGAGNWAPYDGCLQA